MYKVLIVDDEKIEREGIRFLLSMEEGEYQVFEAQNGRQALDILRNEKIEILLTDIKMPHMDGLELSRKARAEDSDLKIVIFTGHSDFAFAQEAIRYGVTDYVLKPVDPDRFKEIFEKVTGEISRRKDKEIREVKEKNFLQQYFLQSYIYSGKEEILDSASEIIDLESWNRWHCAVLIETDQTFFDSAQDTLSETIFKELRREFFYLNLNGRQSLLLFNDVYCDYLLIAKQIYLILKREYAVRFHLAVSRKFEGYENLPVIM